MKLAFCILIAIFLQPLCGITNGSELSKRKVPTLSAKVAIDKAESLIKEKKLKVEGKFLARVEYHEFGPWTEFNKQEKTSGPYWQVTYEPDIFADGGQVYILIYMDGMARYDYGR